MTTINLGRVVGQDGADGEDGRGIVSIEKTGTQGLVDTYTITYTDGTTSTFEVTNGQSGGGGSSLPISFSTTQPPLDGSVVLWVNADAEDPGVDEFTAFTLAGTCTNLAVEDRTELSSRQYLAKATGTNSLYNIIGVKNGSTPISKVEVSSISMGTTGFLVVGCNLSASEQGDLSTLLLYGVGQTNLGFEIPVRGTKQGQYTNNPTVEGSFSDTTKAYVFESRAVTDGFKVTATRVDTGELEVTWTYSNLHATYVPCFGFGRNTAGDIDWYFKKVV